MKWPLPVFACLFLLSLIQAGTAHGGSHEVTKSREAYRLGARHYYAGEFEEALVNFHEALRWRPSHPALIYTVAALQAKTGDTEAALQNLGRIVQMGLYYDVAADSDFVALAGSERFEAIRTKFDSNDDPVNNSAVALTLKEKDLITEGVAFDDRTHTWYVSSIHKRKVVAQAEKRTDALFSDRDLYAAFAIKLDPERKNLWVCSAAIEQMLDYSESDAGASSVICYDLQSGEIKYKYLFPGRDETEHLIGEMALSRSGDIYLSDSATNFVYRIPAGSQTAQVFCGGGEFAGLQGITLNEDESRLFVADYAQGLFYVDMSTVTVNSLNSPDSVCLNGIDGLYFYENSLIAIQNGVTPHRILRVFLDESQRSVQGAEVLEQKNPYFDEPTLGTIVSNTFYYIANSQWSAFDSDGRILPLAKLKEPVILKLQLDTD